MSETVGVIETRSRSRSKTPGLLLHENGDSLEKKGSKKIPTVSLIEEEEDAASQQLQRPKRQRRSAKNAQSDTSNEVSSQESVVSNNKQSKTTTTTTSITTVSTTKQITNGSEEKSSEETSTKTTATTVNNDAQEIPESQSIFNNIFNAIKTSTPILSSKRTKRVTQESKTSPDVDFNLHPAYKEYKEAGEYWNKYPKTDYTYSELSPHRRELGAGVVAMPNMSRRSLDKYQNRVEAMIVQNPAEESFIRRKFLSNMSYQKKAVDLQYDSADEVDVSTLHQKLSARRYSQQNIVYRLYLYVVGVFSSAYSNVKQTIGFNRKYYSSYTPIKRHHQQGLAKRIYNFVQRFVLLCISKVYLFISTVLSLDTWLLYTRSENVQENRKRKRYLLGLLALLPLLLFGVFLLSDETHDASALLTNVNINPLELIHRNIDSLSHYFSNTSPPQLPQLSFSIGWMFSPFIALGAMLNDMMPRKSSPESIKLALDEEKFQLLLQHIDHYVDSTIDQKLMIVNEAMLKDVNNRLVAIIGTHVKDALTKHNYQLTSKDIELVINQIKVQLQNDFNEKEQSIIAKVSLANEENINRIKSLTADELKSVKLEHQNLDLNKIVVMILESNQMSSLIDDRIKSIKGELNVHGLDIADLKKEIGQMKSEFIKKFIDHDTKLNEISIGTKSISDDLLQYKNDNDEQIKDILLKLDKKFSDFSSIDASVRRTIINILGFAGDSDFTDENVLRQWIDHTFVAKSYFEDHLNNLELRLNEAFLKAIDKNAGTLMDDINEQLKNQIKLNIQHEQSAFKIGTGLSVDDIKRIVREILAVYDADKTGLVDYALESAGGEILSTRCTENYRARSAEISIFGIPIWYPNNTPRTVISPAISPGECWAFQGFPGFLVIKLNNFIRVTGFTIEHIPKANAPNGIIDSAPNNFTVWGLTTEFDKNPVLFGTYYYSAEKDAPSLQYFPVTNLDIVQPYKIIELVIESNHGNPKYTCLYRFRVHGDMN